MRVKLLDIERLYGRRVGLCVDCRKLLLHAIVKRIACPLDPKPMCKKCPEHCYAPRYRAQIREGDEDTRGGGWVLQRLGWTICCTLFR